jgi:hypothetical protein
VAATEVVAAPFSNIGVIKVPAIGNDVAYQRGRGAAYRAAASTAAGRWLQAAEESMAAFPFMQGEAVSMWSALIMPPATMRADITQAARFMGGGKRFRPRSRCRRPQRRCGKALRCPRPWRYKAQVAQGAAAASFVDGITP